MRHDLTSSSFSSFSAHQYSTLHSPTLPPPQKSRHGNSLSCSSYDMASMSLSSPSTSLISIPNLRHGRSDGGSCSQATCHSSFHSHTLERLSGSFSRKINHSVDGLKCNTFSSISNSRRILSPQSASFFQSSNCNTEYDVSWVLPYPLKQSKVTSGVFTFANANWQLTFQRRIMDHKEVYGVKVTLLEVLEPGSEARACEVKQTSPPPPPPPLHFKYNTNSHANTDGNSRPSTIEEMNWQENSSNYLPVQGKEMDKCDRYHSHVNNTYDEYVEKCVNCHIKFVLTSSIRSPYIKQSKEFVSLRVLSPEKSNTSNNTFTSHGDDNSHRRGFSMSSNPDTWRDSIYPSSNTFGFDDYITKNDLLLYLNPITKEVNVSFLVNMTSYKPLINNFK